MYVRSAESDGAALSIPSVSGEAEEVLHFDTIDALADHVDYPVYYLSNEGAEIDTITYSELSRMGKRIITIYHWGDAIITISQTDQIYSVVKENHVLADAVHCEFKSEHGIIVEGIFMPQDQSFTGTTVTDLCVIYYEIEGCENVDEAACMFASVNIK